jgi:sortase A
VLAALLALSGAVMLAFEPLTGILADRQQARLAADFTSPEFKTRFSNREIGAGQVLTRVEIPKIGVNAMVVEGTEIKALRAGAGHYSDTALPCEKGNVAIAGHRTTYGAPFMRLDELVDGDEIKLITPERSCTYRVVNGPGGARPRAKAAGWITHPDDGAVIGPLNGSWLTLTTCHPKRSAAKRLIVRAILVTA